jgi:hypothetical protein
VPVAAQTKKKAEISQAKERQKKWGADTARDHRDLLSWLPEGKRISRCVRVLDHRLDFNALLPRDRFDKGSRIFYT